MLLDSCYTHALVKLIKDVENDYLAVRKEGKKTKWTLKTEKHMTNLNNVIECQLGHLQ